MGFLSSCASLFEANAMATLYESSPSFFLRGGRQKVKPKRSFGRYNRYLKFFMPTIPYFFNQCLDKDRLKRLILWSIDFQGESKTIKMLEELKTLGFRYATYAGISLSIDDLSIPPNKSIEVLETETLILQSVQENIRGNKTAIEIIQTVIDTWHRTSENIKQHVIDYFEATDILNPVYMMAFSGARGNISQVRQLVGMRGLMADPKGDIMGFPIRSNFREGLTITEYLISCYGARKGVVDTSLRTADAGYLTRRLVDVAQHIVVQQGSCGTVRGIELQPIIEYGKTILPLQERLLGRILAEDVRSGSTILGQRNEPITHSLVSQLSNQTEKTGIDVATTKRDTTTSKIVVRSPLTCELYEGVCQLCYGWSLTHNSLITIGEAVGIIAGQSIGEPGTQLTMRTFHTGGVFTGEDVQEEFRAPHDGVIHYRSEFPGLLVRTPYGQIAFLVKAPGTMILEDSNQRTEFTIETHTALLFREGDKVRANQLLGLKTTEGGNQRVQTKKIIFSEFPGETILESGGLKKTPRPSEVMKARLEEAKRETNKVITATKPLHKVVAELKDLAAELTREIIRDKKIKKEKNKKQAENPTKKLIRLSVAEEIRKKQAENPTKKLIRLSSGIKKPKAIERETSVDTRVWKKDQLYEITERVGTVWILAGEQIGDLTQVLSLYKTPGQLIDSRTLIGRDGLFQAFEGIVKCEKEQQPIAISQHNPAGKGTANIRVKENQDLLLDLPCETRAKSLLWDTQDEGKRVIYQPIYHGTYTKVYAHSEDTVAVSSETGEILLGPRRIFERSDNVDDFRTMNSSFLYYSPDYSLNKQGGYFWHSHDHASIKNFHGHCFFLNFTNQSKQRQVNDEILHKAWADAPKPNAPKIRISPTKTESKIGTWVQKGTRILAKENLQGQCSFHTTSKGGFLGVPWTDDMRPKLDDKRLSVLSTTYQLNPRSQHVMTSITNHTPSQIGIPFPFLNTLSVRGDFRSGWGYLPELSAQKGKPEFQPNLVLEEPILLQNRNSRFCNREHRVWKQLHFPLSKELSVQKENWLLGLRQRALLRHPYLIERITNVNPLKLQNHLSTKQVIVFCNSTWAQLLIPPTDLTSPTTTRLHHTMFEWCFHPFQGFTKKHLVSWQAGQSLNQQLHGPGRKGPTYSYIEQIYLAVLYQPVHECSLERINKTRRQLKAHECFENSTKNILPSWKPFEVSAKTVQSSGNVHPRDLVPGTSYSWQNRPSQKGKANFLDPISFKTISTPSSRVDKLKLFQQCEHFWIKQSASYLEPKRKRPKMCIQVLLLPSNITFTEKSGFACRFLLKTLCPTRRSHIQIIFEKPWNSNFTSRGNSWSIGFGETLRMNAKQDDHLKAANSLVLFGDVVTRRRKYQKNRGETIVSSQGKPKALLVCDKDVRTYAIDGRKMLLSIGDLVRQGDEIVPGICSPTSGQILEITPTYFRVRHGQSILYSKSAALHIRSNRWIPQGHPLTTLSYQRLITGDIVQGIPKIEQFFEGSHSSENEDLPTLLLTTYRTISKTRPASEAFQESIALIQQKIIENIQKIYISQGVSINDRHFEIIVKQMTSRVQIRDPGDTGLFIREILPFNRVKKINVSICVSLKKQTYFSMEDYTSMEDHTIDYKKTDKVNSDENNVDNKTDKVNSDENNVDNKRAFYEPIIVGITSTALNSNSFLSAASFQETSRILTRDSLEGKIDFLQGLKERVILGDLIPAGTGLHENIIYSKIIIDKINKNRQRENLKFALENHEFLNQLREKHKEKQRLLQEQEDLEYKILAQKDSAKMKKRMAEENEKRWLEKSENLSQSETPSERQNKTSS